MSGPKAPPASLSLRRLRRLERLLLIPARPATRREPDHKRPDTPRADLWLSY
jgi:hypothetical protein